MRSSMLAVIAAIAAAPAVAVAQPAEGAAPASDASPRALHVGVGVGVAVTGDGEDASVMKVRLGSVGSTRLTVALEGTLVSDRGLRYRQLEIAASYAPWTSRLFMRGGLGFSDLGPSARVGLGLALGDRRGLDLTLNVDAQRDLELPPEPDDIRGTSIVSAWLGVDWY